MEKKEAKERHLHALHLGVYERETAVTELHTRDILLTLGTAGRKRPRDPSGELGEASPKIARNACECILKVVGVYEFWWLNNQNNLGCYRVMISFRKCTTSPKADTSSQDVLTGFYSSDTVKRWNWEKNKSIRSEFDKAVNGGLHLIRMSTVDNNSKSLVVYGNGSFNTGTNLSSLHET
ncbi:hypothetical protein B0O80DRAFT_425169 [Mortierella sp. GBAus27b]|nr:hypothetical protein B0O80DRAFT_425169 [Mortierella sp. GBAus27b]